MMKGICSSSHSGTVPTRSFNRALRQCWLGGIAICCTRIKTRRSATGQHDRLPERRSASGWPPSRKSPHSGRRQSMTGSRRIESMPISGTERGTPDYLPLAPNTGCSLSGLTDNWWTGLEQLNRLFVKEHNAICESWQDRAPTHRSGGFRGGSARERRHHGEDSHRRMDSRHSAPPNVIRRGSQSRGTRPINAQPGHPRHSTQPQTLPGTTGGVSRIRSGTEDSRPPLAGYPGGPTDLSVGSRSDRQPLHQCRLTYKSQTHEEASCAFGTGQSGGPPCDSSARCESHPKSGTA